MTEAPGGETKILLAPVSVQWTALSSGCLGVNRLFKIRLTLSPFIGKF